MTCPKHDLEQMEMKIQLFEDTAQNKDEIDLVLPPSEKDFEIEFDGLTTCNIWSYGVGHFQNDITSTILLSFLPLFLKEISPIDSERPGYWVGIVVVVGQVVDSLMTPLIGFLSDRTHTRIGKRKPWHVFGSVFTLISFIMLLEPCMYCSSDTGKILNSTIFFCLYNIGWAACQVSHMSLVPSLSVSRIRRDKLNNLRNSFTFISNFIGLLSMLLTFSVVTNPFRQFLVVSLITGGFGVIATVVFWFGVPEEHLVKICINKAKAIQHIIENNLSIHESPFYPSNHPSSPSSPLLSSIRKIADKKDENELQNVEMSVDLKKHIVSVTGDHDPVHAFNWKNWLTRRMFYQYGVVYMCTRLCYNISQNLLVFFLIFTLRVQEPSKNVDLSLYLAIFPLIIYLSSCIASFLSGKLFKKIGRKKTFVVGTANLVLSALVMTYLTPESYYIFYFIAILYGAGQSLSMNASTAFIAEVIGRKGSEGAIVYGLYSFLDKIANGLAFFFILQSPLMESNDPNFIRYVTAWVPASAAFLGCILVIFGEAPDYKPEMKDDDPHKKLIDEFVE